MNCLEKYQKHQELKKEFKRKLSLIEKIFTGPSKKNQEWYNEQIHKIYGPYIGVEHEIHWG